MLGQETSCFEKGGAHMRIFLKVRGTSHKFHPQCLAQGILMKEMKEKRRGSWGF